MEGQEEEEEKEAEKKSNFQKHRVKLVLKNGTIYFIKSPTQQRHGIARCLFHAF